MVQVPIADGMLAALDGEPRMPGVAIVGVGLKIQRYRQASGLRQVHELVLRLRGAAGDRQVPGAPRVRYAQLYGAPGTAGVSIIST